MPFIDGKLGFKQGFFLQHFATEVEDDFVFEGGVGCITDGFTDAFQLVVQEGDIVLEF